MNKQKRNKRAVSNTTAFFFSEIPQRFSLTWVSTHKDSCWHGKPNVGITGLWLACPGLDVAKDQLPSPWSLGAPAGKDICQRESWQRYFLFHLGLSLIHPSCSFAFSSIFFLVFTLNPTLSLISHIPILSVPSFPLSFPSIPILLPLSSSSLSLSPVSRKAPHPRPPPPSFLFPLCM